MNRQLAIKDVVTPKPGLMVNGPCYWLCEDGDPKKALFYGDSPQCNSDKRIPESMLKSRIYEGVRNLQIVFIQTSYVPRRD